MTVADLIAQLQDCNPDAVVVLSGDRELNEIGPVDEVLHGAYRPANTWSGEFNEGGSRERETAGAVCLVPVN